MKKIELEHVDFSYGGDRVLTDISFSAPRGAMVGILGGFTTFSSFGLETFQLLKQGHSGLAFGYAFSSLIMGVAVLAAGFYLLQALLKH